MQGSSVDDLDAGGLLQGSSVDDLDAEGLLVALLLVVDVDEDLFLARAVARGQTQADGIRLTSFNLQQRHHQSPHPSSRHPTLHGC